MTRRIKQFIGFISIFIFIITVVFYLEGFFFYSFNGNYGFVLSLFAGPLGLIMGLFSAKENKAFKLLGVYGNSLVMVFAFLYWPVGYILEWLMK